MSEQNRFSTRIFSVMRRREDLPEMTWPLAILFLIGVAVFAAAGARLATPVVDGAPFDVQNLLGVAAALPFLPIAACLYALLILLWRRIASLAATPLAYLTMRLFGASVFVSIVLTLALLFVSYVFAVSLIARENRFRRLTTLSLAIAACLVLAAIAWFGWEFDDFAAFTNAYRTAIPALLAEMTAAYMQMPAPLAPSLFAEVARELLMLSPAFCGVLAIVLAWLIDFLARTAFRILSCEDVFIEITDRVTLPLSYAIVYAAVFILALLTPASSPLASSLLRSVLYVMLLPCAAVGVRSLMRFLEDKFYHLTRERLLATLVLVLAVSFLGVMQFLLLTSAVGTVWVIRENARRTKRE